MIRIVLPLRMIHMKDESERNVTKEAARREAARKVASRAEDKIAAIPTQIHREGEGITENTAVERRRENTAVGKDT